MRTILLSGFALILAAASIAPASARSTTVIGTHQGSVSPAQPGSILPCCTETLVPNPTVPSGTGVGAANHNFPHISLVPQQPPSPILPPDRGP
jgi:hypothetical protein